MPQVWRQSPSAVGEYVLFTDVAQVLTKKSRNWASSAQGSAPNVLIDAISLLLGLAGIIAQCEGGLACRNGLMIAFGTSSTPQWPHHSPQQREAAGQEVAGGASFQVIAAGIFMGTPRRAGGGPGGSWPRASSAGAASAPRAPRPPPSL